MRVIILVGPQGSGKSSCAKSMKGYSKDAVIYNPAPKELKQFIANCTNPVICVEEIVNIIKYKSVIQSLSKEDNRQLVLITQEGYTEGIAIAPNVICGEHVKF